MKTTSERVKEIMVEMGFDTKEMSINDLCILYLKAQTDQLRKQLKSSVTDTQNTLDTLDTQTEYGVRKVTDNKESEVL